MLDDRVRSVLARMEADDAADRDADVPISQRSLAVGPDSGRLLFALVAPNAGCEVLEIGSSHGYSTIWLAAAARILGGRVVTLEQEPGKIEVWRRNIADAGLEEWVELVAGDAKETLPDLEDGFDVVFLDAWKDDYEVLFELARTKLDPGGVVVADNVTTSSTVEAYAAARQADPTLVSVTVPIGHGLELTTVLAP
ncbi:MAG TPA: class I SAM-dependent methyltransferase [Gaiella sp.]|nr:class I SAM-dependent methyltransferase [Gaiella sp.]